MGIKVFTLAHGDAPAAEAYRDFVTVSDSGFGISSLKSQDGTELLAAPIGLVVVSDTSDTWAHGINQFRQEMGRPTLLSSSVVENGPVTRVTRHRAAWQNSEIVLDIAQFAGLDFVELRFVIDWREHEQMLKLEIPTALTQPKIYAKVPGEVIERRINGEEEPYQDWGAVQGKIGSADYTVALLNNSTYSYDCLNGLLSHCPDPVSSIRPPQSKPGTPRRQQCMAGSGAAGAEILAAGQPRWLHGPCPRPACRGAANARRVCNGFRSSRNPTMGAILS